MRLKKRVVFEMKVFSEASSLINVVSPVDVSEIGFCSRNSDCPMALSFHVLSEDSSDQDYCCPIRKTCCSMETFLEENFQTITAAFGGLFGFIIAIVLVVTVVVIVWYLRRNPNHPFLNVRQRLRRNHLRSTFGSSTTHARFHRLLASRL